MAFAPKIQTMAIGLKSIKTTIKSASKAYQQRF
jgi:hypothetical protein